MSVTFRPGAATDNPAIFQIQMRALADLSRRLGDADNAFEDPQFIAARWERDRLLFDYLAADADQFWVAEQDGVAIGYARAVIQDGVRQLTEFFVHPDNQSAGVGRQLLVSAFPAEGARRRTIIASPDIRAQVLYLKNGVTPRFTVGFFYGRPERVSQDADLTFVPVTATPDTLALMRDIDETILEFERDAHHQFLLGDRRGLLVYRGEEVVGYCYTGNATGPVALLHETDSPAVLAYLENAAAERGHRFFGLEIPLINRAAIDHMLERGHRLHQFVISFMSDEPFGRFQNYIFASPPLFL